MDSTTYETKTGNLFEFATKPFQHQQEEWELSRDSKARAILWEQGTGKSKLTIDQACWLWLNGLIDAVVVVAPNGVHRNWVDSEIPDHIPQKVMKDVRAFHYQAPRASTKWHQKALDFLVKHKGFAWLTISYEGFMTKKGKATLIDFFEKRRIFYVLDESHNVKTPSAERTKSILRSAKYAPYRRILTGTPIAQGPFDAYSQIKFLDANFWSRHGFSTFAEFKKHFGVFQKVWNPNVTRTFDPVQKRWVECDGAYVDTVVAYRNLGHLNAMLQEIASRVTKDEVLDLPPKLYQKRLFNLTPEQSKYYKQMRDDALVWLFTDEAQQEMSVEVDICNTCQGSKEIIEEGFIYACPECCSDLLGDEQAGPVVAAPLAITKLLRLQQILCGYLPTPENEEEPLHVIPGKNPRLEALMDVIEESQNKVIVWARFQYDITLIMDALKKKGIRAVRYDGLVDDDGRAEAKALFKGVRPVYENGSLVARVPVPEEEQAKVFVGNPAAGATGLTLTEAKTVVYYSNSFKLIDRLQSEDRAHRIGQDNNVLYVDLVAEDTVDEEIVTALRNKFNIASLITGDKLKEWI